MAQTEALITELNTKCLAYNGLTPQTAAELEKARNQMLAEKRRYFEAQILYDLLGQSLGQHEAEVKRQGNIWRTIDQALTLAEARQLLSASNPAESLLGLTRDDLANKANPTEVYAATLQQAIEANLKDLCLQVAAFYSCPTSEETDKMALAKFSQLPQKIHERNKDAQEHKIRMTQMRQEILQKSWAYYNIIFETFEILWEITTEFKFKHQPMKDTTLDQYLVAVCENIGLKTRVLKLELLLSLYTDETLKALATVRKAMEEQVSASEGKLANLLKQVAGFDELGDEFREISQAYMELKENIAVVQDDLRRLQQ